jgi:hypothetical protein
MQAITRSVGWYKANSDSPIQESTPSDQQSKACHKGQPHGGGKVQTLIRAGEHDKHYWYGRAIRICLKVRMNPPIKLKTNQQSTY